MRLGLARDHCPGNSHLALDSGYGLAGGLADDARHGSLRGYRHGRRLAAQLLDAPRDRALVVASFRQMLLEALLVRRLLGQLDVRSEIGLQLGFLRMCLVQPLNELGVTFVHGFLSSGFRSRLPARAALTHKDSRRRRLNERPIGHRSGQRIAIQGGIAGMSETKERVETDDEGATLARELSVSR